MKNLARWASWVYLGHRWYGEENIPQEGAFLMAPNHASYLDPVLAGCSMRRALHFLARRSLFRFRPFGWFITELNSVPVQREGVSKEAIREVLRLLKEGKGVLVFPEGTRCANGRIGTMESGVIRIAQLADVPVVPTYISGTYRALGRGMWFPLPMRTSIRYGAPLRFDRKGDVEEAAENLRQRLVDLAGDHEPKEATEQTNGRETAPVGKADVDRAAS